MSLIISSDYPIEVKKLADGLSDDELFEFCVANKELRIERDENKNIIITSPVGSESGYYESTLISLLFAWNSRNKTGMVFSSSAGFILPDGSMRSPDASWIPLKKWKAVEPKKRKKFAPICPDFVAEIRSETDNVEYLRVKMQKWIANGARLAWLIDPQEEKAYVYRRNGSIQIFPDWTKPLSGEDVLQGFELDFDLLRIP